MTVYTDRGSGTPVTTGTTWANTANAVDGTPPANPATYATLTSSTSAAVGTLDVAGFDFSTVVGSGDTLTSVTVGIRHLENNTGRFASVRYQPFDGSTAIGTQATATLATAARDDSTTFPVTLAQLRSAGFKVRVTVTGASSTQSRVFSLDHVNVTADYSAPSVNVTPLDTVNGNTADTTTLAIAYPKVDTLVDIFATQIDPAVWTPTGTTAWGAGRAVLFTPSGAGGASLTTVARYDLTESSVHVQLLPPAEAASRATWVGTVLENGDGVWLGVGEVAPAWDPLSIGWVHVFWAEDPGWSHPADGGAVTSWRNAANTAYPLAGQSGSEPTYRASYTNLAGRPALDFDGANDLLYNLTTPTLEQPNHYFVVGWSDPTSGGFPTLVDGEASRNLLRVKSGTTLQMYAGASAAFGTAVSGAFQIAALFAGASSTCRVNGQSYTGVDTGGLALTGLRVGGDAGGNVHKGGLAFVGIKDTALTTQELEDLSAWATSTYGVPAL